MSRLWIMLVLFLLPSLVFANLPYTPVTFPRDEGAHYDNIPYTYSKMIEWWYFNGKMTTDEGKALSYDVAIFNGDTKILGYPVVTPMLHIQVADLDQKQAYGTSKDYWPGVGQFSTKNLDITVNHDYVLKKVTEHGKTIYMLTADGVQDKTHLQLDLRLEPITEPFLISGNGLMQMLDNTNSYYYTIPRFKTTGTITINGIVHHISKEAGDSWMDHQWGDFDVQKHGWEWFSFRLKNGLLANVFLFLETKNNRAIGGLANVILPNGEKRFIPFSDFKVARDHYWVDSDTNQSYPLTFHLNFPTLGLDIQNDAAFPEQELHGYWEGLANVKAVFDKRDWEGFSYTEIVYS